MSKSGVYKVGIYPGTFDPITKGHTHIIKRAAKLVDHLVVGVADNAPKKPLFSLEERFDLVSKEVESLSLPETDIEVKKFDTLLMDFAKSVEARIVFRGLRAVSDFEYEFQMTGMNANLAPDIETIFLMANDKHQFVSSAFVKEIRRLKGDVSPFVPPHVVSALDGKFPA